MIYYNPVNVSCNKRRIFCLLEWFCRTVTPHFFISLNSNIGPLSFPSGNAI